MATTAELSLALPEIFLLTMACAILVLDLFLPQERRDVTYGLAQFTLLGAAAITVLSAVDMPVVAFAGTFVRDTFADVVKVAIFLLVAGVFLYARSYLRDRDIYQGEFFVLGLFGALGMAVTASGHSLLTLYVGIELLALAEYAMIGLRRDSPVATEAAMKYFILSALATGLMLYGMSMVYGVTGSLDLSIVSASLDMALAESPLLMLGLVFLIVGLAFKIGAVPFHMWIPDVYQGAPTAVTLYLSTAPKVAYFALFVRLLVDGLETFVADWQQMLAVLAALSLVVGNVVALAQTNLKRMLAYSTISHVGFLLLGLLSGTEAGYSAALFYAIAYALMSLGGFGMVVMLSRTGFEADRLEDFKGLNERNPWLAFMMLLIMFSLAGVPPTVGFYAKLVVLGAVIDAGLLWLAIVGIVFSVVGAFYYLRVIKLMYFDKPEGEGLDLAPGKDAQWLMGTNGVLMVALGIFPGLLMGVCAAAFGIGA